MDIKKYMAIDGEKPLDTIKPDGGFSAIFRTIACVGDSLSSGEFESVDPVTGERGYHDMFEYSWGQFIARATGAKVYNFSRGGMTANVYMNGWAEGMGYFDPEKAAQAYIIALGANDVINQGQPFGSVDDIDPDDPSKNKPTFAGYYSAIIQKYKEISPDARFFLVTMPRVTENADTPADGLRCQHAELLCEIAKKFSRTYVIDLFRYAPVYDEEFQHYFGLHGHMDPAGYLLTAEMMMSYIDYIIRNDPRAFAEVGFIGTPYHTH